MSDQDIVIAVRGDISGGQQVKQNLNEIAAAGDKASGAAAKLLEAHKTANSGIVSAAKQSAAAIGGVQVATAGATREIIVLAHEMLTGNFSRIPGSVLVLTERMGNLHGIVDKIKGAFNPATAAAAAFSAVMLGVAVHVNEVQGQLNKIHVAFDAVGNGTLYNRDLIKGYVDQLSNLAEVSRKDAVEAEEALASSLHITGDQLKTLNEILPDVAAGLGKDVPSAAKFLADAMNDPTRAADQLNRQFGLLSPAQRDLIKNFNDLGEVEKEQNVLLDAMTTRFKGLHDEGLTPLDQILQDITQHFDDAAAAAEKYGRIVAHAVFPGASYAYDKANQFANYLTTPISKQGSAQTDAADEFAFLGEQQQKYNEEINRSLDLADQLNGFTSKRATLEGQIAQMVAAENDALAHNDETTAARLKSAIADANQQLKEMDRRHEEQAYNLSKDVVAERALREAAKQARLEQEALRKEVDGPTGRAFKHLVETVDTDLEGAFKKAFEGGTHGFKDMLSGFKKTFEDFLAEMAYRALAQPIIVPVLSAVGGSLGLSSSAVGSILGSQGAGSSFGIGNLSSLSSFLPKSATGGIFNSIGSSLGFGFSTPGGGFTPGSIFGGATLGNTLLGGSIGGLAANLLGLGSKNPIINMGSSTAGALIGQALIPVPVLGAVAGSFLGSALGGLFGGSDKQYPFSSSAISTVNGQTAVRYAESLDGGNAGQARTAAQSLVDSMKAITSALGATSYTLDKVFAVGYNDGRGNLGTGYFGGSGGGYFAAHQQFTGLKSMQDAVNKTLASMLADATFTGLDPQLQAIIKQVAAKGGSAQDIVSNVSFAKSYLDGSLFGTQDPLKSALDALNAQFDAMKKTATDLGLSLDPLNAAYEKQKKAIEDSVAAQKAGFSSLEDMANSFKSFLDGEALGSNSSLSPMEKLQLAQSNFGSLLSQAQGGDYSHVKDLLSAGSTLIDQGRGVYASSVDFANLEGFVRSSITQIAHAAGVPGYASGTISAASGWSMVGEDGPELIRFRGGEQVYSNTQTKSIGGSSREVRELGRQLMIMNQKLETLGDIHKEVMRTRKTNERVISKIASTARA